MVVGAAEDARRHGPGGVALGVADGGRRVVGEEAGTGVWRRAVGSRAGWGAAAAARGGG